MRTVRVNKVEFDSSKKIREDADSIVVPAILTRESILPFGDGKGYRSAKELQDAAWTLEGAWVVAYNHISTVFVTNRVDVRGRVENVSFDAKINGVIGDIRFLKAASDKTLLDGVKKGELKDVSVAYFSEDVFIPGKFGDEPYDFAQTNFMFGHVAAGVPEGRCPSPFCGMAVDSLFAKPHADPEITEKYVRIRVRDPDLFVEGSFRTIVLSAKEGIHTIIGKLKSDPKGATVVQNYMFELEKDWTMEKAKAWVKEHKDSVAHEMTEEELRTKIEELEKQRQELIEKLYPRAPEVPEVEARKLRLELTLIDGQVHALTEVLAEKLAGVEPASHSEGEESEKAKGDQLDPAVELARSRRYFHSNMSLFGTE